MFLERVLIYSSYLEIKKIKNGNENIQQSPASKS